MGQLAGWLPQASGFFLSFPNSEFVCYEYIFTPLYFQPTTGSFGWPASSLKRDARNVPLELRSYPKQEGFCTRKVGTVRFFINCARVPHGLSGEDENGTSLLSLPKFIKNKKGLTIWNQRHAVALNPRNGPWPVTHGYGLSESLTTDALSQECAVESFDAYP